MSKGFMSLRFHIADLDSDKWTKQRVVSPTEALRVFFGTGSGEFGEDEMAARFYLSQELGFDDRREIRALSAPNRLELVPDLNVISQQQLPLTQTRLVIFRQSQLSIPVFGSHAFVEMNLDRSLVCVDAAALAPQDELAKLSPVPTLDEATALAHIAKLTGAPLEALTGRFGELVFFFSDEHSDWRLAYFFAKIPWGPLEITGEPPRPDDSLASLYPLFNYLVDAHEGIILCYYAARAALTPAVPTICFGEDVCGQRQQFYGHLFSSGFELRDTQRNLLTYDAGYACVTPSTLLPAQPVANAGTDWEKSNPAAISAHVNAGRVYDFYNSLLKRKSIDDAGMPIVSVVNCTKCGHTNPPVWANASWDSERKCMWYGQDLDGNGNLRSMARFLDIIAHEITHGVIQHSSALIYRSQSGALEESFADIFGVMVKNWDKGEFIAVSKWDWEIGSGLGHAGKPLRDLSDPTRTGAPDDMKKYLNTPVDSGGVHTNANIHNKAAHNLFMANGDTGGTKEKEAAFTAEEIAILYYYTLLRLNPLATFAKALETLIEVAKTYSAGDSTTLKFRISAIQKAYQDVGIV